MTSRVAKQVNQSMATCIQQVWRFCFCVLSHGTELNVGMRSSFADPKNRGDSSLTFQCCWLLLLFCGLFNVGCATAPYRFGKFSAVENPAVSEPVIQYGKPHRVLDSVAWAAGLGPRLLTCNPNVNKHELSDETKECLVDYMCENDLNDVLVRVNQYDPQGEWRRLQENDAVSPGWRYTAGVLSIAQYTLLPGRVFGGDQYNPYTNTLSINSDVSAVALHEAAFAKDIHGRSLPGTYAVVNQIPLVGLWRHTRGINDVLGYAQVHDRWSIEEETYCVVYPQMGIYSTALPGSFFPFWQGMLLTAGGAAAGHISGQVALSQRRNERDHKLNDPTNPAEQELAEATSPHPMKGATIQFAKHEVDSLFRD